jgi:hypothetical protein
VETELTQARDSICLGYLPWEYAEEYTEQGVLTRKRMPFIEASRLPVSIDPKAERRQLRLQGQALGVQLHRELVLDGMKHPVVIPRDVIREYTPLERSCGGS